MERVSFEMSDIQHKEWFITTLLSHIRLPLMHQNIETQSEALEIAMKLEALLVSGNVVNINQIQTQLPNMTLQLQDIKKGKEHHEEVWCTQCHAQGHTKDNFLDF